MSEFPAGTCYLWLSHVGGSAQAAVKVTVHGPEDRIVRYTARTFPVGATLDEVVGSGEVIGVPVRQFAHTVEGTRDAIAVKYALGGQEASRGPELTASGDMSRHRLLRRAEEHPVAGLIGEDLRDLEVAAETAARPRGQHGGRGRGRGRGGGAGAAASSRGAEGGAASVPEGRPSQPQPQPRGLLGRGGARPISSVLGRIRDNSVTVKVVKKHILKQ